jgi:hypothetical protein
MTAPVSFARAEPAVLIGLIQALGQSALGLITAFGVNLSSEQTAAIHGFAGALLAIVGAIWTRGRVASVASLDALEESTPPARPVAMATKRVAKKR